MTAEKPTSLTTRRRFLKTASALPVFGAAGASRHVRRAAAAVSSQLSPPNETVQKAREAALLILKPSRKDLEHGFDLHANSVVFESYGFAPRAAPDGDLVRKAIEDGASEAELSDLREELMMTRYATDPREKKEFLEAFRAAGVTCILQNAGEEGNDPLRLIKRLARFIFATDLLRDELYKAVSPDDIVAAKKRNRLCLYFSANGVPLNQQWNTVRDELGFIRIFQQLGIRMMHVSYNRRNPLGDGCGEVTDGGLSDFGRAAIAEMNRVGVIVDVAHSGWRTSLESAKASKQPMVASHTTAAALHRHIRSKPDVANTDQHACMAHHRDPRRDAGGQSFGQSRWSWEIVVAVSC